MKLTCEICGGSTLVKQSDGLFRCDGCGICYTEEQIKTMLSQQVPEAPAPTVSVETENEPQAKSLSLKDRIVLFFINLSWGQKAFLFLILLVVSVSIFLILYALNGEIEVAKDHAKEEVQDAWKSVDSSIELRSIHFNSVKINKATDEQITEILSNYVKYFPFYDETRHKYSNEYAYWDSIGYDPYSDHWTIYTVTGSYRVQDGANDYFGSFSVWVVRAREDGFRIWKTEIEVPKQLRP